MLQNLINSRKLLLQYSLALVLCVVSSQYSTAQQCGEIICTNYVNHQGFPAPEWVGTQWILSGEVQEYAGYPNEPALLVAVVDDSCNAWRTPGIDNGDTVNLEHCFGQFNGAAFSCPGATQWRGSRSEAYFIFQTTDPVQMDSLVSMLENKIPIGHSVLIYTYIQYDPIGSYSIYDNWPIGLYDHFVNLGSDSIVPYKPDNGFISFYVQGDSTTYQEVYGPPIDSNIVQLLTFTGSVPACLTSLLPFSDTSFCSGDSTVINATHGYDNYLWSTGDTTLSISVNQDTVYSVVASQNLGCDMVDSVTITLLNCTGIEVEENSGFSIYPNPSSGSLTLEKTWQENNVNLCIYNLLGELVYNEKLLFQGESHSINLQLPPGVYQVILSNQNRKSMHRVVIE